ncbi:hypothetical protein V5799_000800, partial [Amblyomma americanum]
ALRIDDSPVLAMLEAKVDDARRYFIKLNVPFAEEAGAVVSLEPRLEMGCPHTPAVIVQGGIKVGPSAASITLQSNMPKDQPAYLRATIEIDESKRMRIDTTARLPSLDVSFTAQSTKPQERISVTTATLEYQWQGQRRHTAQFNSKVQNLSTQHIAKGTMNAEMQYSQYPEYNWKVTADVQRAPGAQHNEHDVKLWWGENLSDDQRHIHVLAISKKNGEYGEGSKGSSEGRLVIFAPVWDIDFNVFFNAMLDVQDTSKGTFNGEIQSHGERVMQVEMNHNLESRSPLRMFLNARVETRHFRFLYSDQLEERNPNQYVGRTNLEWGREGKSIATEYVIMSRQGPGSSVHDVEYKISYPGMRTPAVHRTKIRITRGALDASSSTEVNGENYLMVSIQNTPKLKEFRFDSPLFQTKLSKAIKTHSVIYTAELRPHAVMVNSIVTTMQIKGSLQNSMEIHAELLWDADRDVNRKLRFTSTIVRTATDGRPGYRYSATYQRSTDMSITANGIYTEDIIRGPHSIEFGIGGTGLPPRTVALSYTRGETSANVMFGYTLNGADQIRIEYNRDEDHAVQQFDIAVTSVYPELNGKRLNIQRSFERPVSFKIQYDHAANEIYRLEFTDSSGGNRIDTNVKIRTPFPRYATQEFRITGDYSPAVTNVIIEATSSTNKLYRFTYNHELRGSNSFLATLAMQTPHENARNGKLTIRFNNNNNEITEGQITIEFNDRTPFDLTGNVRMLSPYNFDGRMSLKAVATPDLEATIMSRLSSPLNGAFQLKFVKEGEEMLATSVTLTNQPREFTGRLDLSGAMLESSAYILVERKHPEPEHRIYSITIGGTEPELKCEIETEKRGDMRVTKFKYQPLRRPQDFEVLTIENNDWTDNDQKLIVTIEPRPNVKIGFDYLHYMSKDTVKSKLIWSLDENRLGYELKSRAEGEHAYNSLLKIIYLRREIDIHNNFAETPNSMDFSMKILLNAVMMPDRALELSYRQNRIQNGWEAMAALRHPTFSKDIVFNARIQTDMESTPLLVSAQLQPGDAMNRIYFNLAEKLNDITATNRSLHIHIHHEDRNLFDASMTMYHTMTPERPVFAGYYWSWTTPRLGPKRGHVTFFIGRNGVAQLDYDSFLGKWTASGQAQRAANGDETVDVMVQGERDQFRGRIIYNLRKYRFEGLTFDSEGKVSRSLELSASNSTRNAALKVEVSHYEGNNKITDFSYGFEKRGDRAYRSKVYFPPEKIRAIQAMLDQNIEKLAEIDVGALLIDIQNMFFDSYAFMDKNFASPFLNMLLDEFGEIMGEAVIALSEILYESPFGELLAHWQRRIDEVMRELAEAIKNLIGTLAQSAQSVASFGGGQRRRRRDVSENWDELGRYLSSMFDEMWNAPLVKQIVKKMDEATDYVTDKFREMMYRVRRSISDGMDAIMENPDYKAMESMIAELYEPGKYEGNYDFWKNLKASLQSSYKTSDLAVVREADRKNGKYIVDFNLPTDLDSIRQNWHEWLAEDDDDSRPKEGMDLEPDMFGYLTSMFQRKWMPPFDGEAMIIGHQHFITFDGTMYSATGDCTYLLARDFVDGNFTVLLKYYPENSRVPGRVAKSMIVQLGQSYIEIFPDDGSVFLNGQAVDLPLILEEGEVIARRVDDVITVEDEKALRVSCHLYYDVCTVKINGWYFGNTAGLLGTYNNEPGDDLMKPRGQVTSNVAQFMKKWEASRGCKAPVKVLSEQAAVDSEGYKMCETYFKDDDSPLAEGFWQRQMTPDTQQLRARLPHRDQSAHAVWWWAGSWHTGSGADTAEAREQPEPYFDLCLRHMAMPGIEPRQAICNVSMAYLMQLKKYAITARLPPECNTCAVPGGVTLMPGEYRNGILTRPISMDIVLVVEEDACHADVVRELDSTIRLVDKELVSAGFSNNRFALVGFGHGSGYNSMPHVRTARGNIFFESHSLPLATQKMRLDTPANPEGREVKKDVFDAIRYASVLPFRPNVAKAIIVVACADCKEEESEVRGRTLFLLQPLANAVQLLTRKRAFREDIFCSHPAMAPLSCMA